MTNTCLLRCSNLWGEIHQENLISENADFVSHPKYHATIAIASLVT